MLKDKQVSKADTYKKNQRKSKALKILTPLVFWLFIALGFILFFYAVKNSLGNISGALDQLNTKHYNAEEIEANYQALAEKWGEVQYVGGGAGGLKIVFLNIKDMLFNGFAVLSGIASGVSILGAFLLGKWVLPFWRKAVDEENRTMVDLTILENK